MQGQKSYPKEEDGEAKVASLCAGELNQMTPDEREEVFCDVHGVKPTMVETPEMIQQSLSQLRAALEKVPRAKRRSYHLALFLKPSLAHDDEFQLIFLRCHKFNAAMAATRVCLYFDLKLFLFGPSKLVKKITIKDLSPDDLASFKVGSVFFLPEKDRSGRRVLLINSLNHQYKEWPNLFRCFWYLILTAVLEDEEVQKKGVVVVCLVQKPTEDETTVQQKTKIGDWQAQASPRFHIMPVAISAVHVLSDDSVLLKEYVSRAQLACGKKFLTQCRTNYGSFTENQYCLLSYGIRLHPRVCDSTFGQSLIQQMVKDRSVLEQRREEEEEAKGRLAATTNSSNTLILSHPREQDVLLGRGKYHVDWIGNVKLKEIIVGDHCKQYERSKERLGKTFVALDVMAKVKEKGGRFLSRTDDGWKIADDGAPQLKILQALRAKVRESSGGSASSCDSKNHNAVGSAANVARKRDREGGSFSF